MSKNQGEKVGTQEISLAGPEEQTKGPQQDELDRRPHGIDSEGKHELVYLTTAAHKRKRMLPIPSLSRRRAPPLRWQQITKHTPIECSAVIHSGAPLALIGRSMATTAQMLPYMRVAVERGGRAR